MRDVLIVGLGGCFGAVVRYGISELVKQRIPTYAHAGTFVVNAVGCLLIGFVMTLASQEGTSISPAWKLLIVTGCLGALTTFSTFGHDTVSLVQQSRIQDAVINVIGNLAIGLAAVCVGIKVAGWMAR